MLALYNEYNTYRVALVIIVRWLVYIAIPI